MKALISHPGQPRQACACPFGAAVLCRRGSLLIPWMIAALLLSACASPTAAAGPTAASSASAAAPTAELSPITPTIPATQAAPSATAPTRTGATLTPWPTNTLAFLPSATPAAGTPWPACAGSRDSRLQVGAIAAVSKDPPQANNVRDLAGANQLKIGQIQPGECVTVLDGPRCVGGWVWWKIRSQDSGLTGWTAEGDGDNYWLVPQP